MPKVWKFSMHPNRETNANCLPMAICPMGYDIIDPLPQGKRQVKFLLVVIDYFIKWVEAEALAIVTDAKI